jgi:hypothetical protein
MTDHFSLHCLVPQPKDFIGTRLDNATIGASQTAAQTKKIMRGISNFHRPDARALQ